MSATLDKTNLVMICGEAIAGKTASLRNIKKPEGVMYLNCESGKRPPFKNLFWKGGIIITDPYQIYEGFTAAEKRDDIHTIIIDSTTFLMDMFYSVHVITSSDTMAAWGEYGEYFRNLMQQYVALSTKTVIFTAHVERMLNEQSMQMEKRIPIKGALAKNGIEAFFSTIVTARTMPMDTLKDYANPLLVITPDDKILGFKHVFQTRLTKETIGERGMRAPINMWSIPETFIDNDCQILIDRLNKFYN
jgi:hypothetical protein